MMKEWFPRHQWSINWMCSPHNAQWTALWWERKMMVCPAASQGGSEERKYALSYWLACPAAGQWRSEKRVRNSLRCLLFCPVEVTRAKWHQSFSLGEIYKFEHQRPKQFPHKMIIWNSFCYPLNKFRIFSCNFAKYIWYI